MSESQHNTRLDERYRVAQFLDSRANAEAIQAAAHQERSLLHALHAGRARLIRELAESVRAL